MSILEDFNQLAGLPEDVEIDGKTYKAYCLNFTEMMQYQANDPQITELDESGKPKKRLSIVWDGNSMKNSLWVLYCNLRRQDPEVEKMGFEEFVKAAPGNAHLFYEPLISKSLDMSRSIQKKKI